MQVWWTETENELHFCYHDLLLIPYYFICISYICNKLLRHANNDVFLSHFHFSIANDRYSDSDSDSDSDRDCKCDSQYDHDKYPTQYWNCRWRQLNTIEQNKAIQ